MARLIFLTHCIYLASDGVGKEVPGPVENVGVSQHDLFGELFGNMDPYKNYMCPLPSSPVPKPGSESSEQGD